MGYHRPFSQRGLRAPGLVFLSGLILLAACQGAPASTPPAPAASASPTVAVSAAGPPAPSVGTPAPAPPGLVLATPPMPAPPGLALATPPLPPPPPTCPVTAPFPRSATDPPPEDFPALAWYRNAARTLWAGLAPAYRENQWFAGRGLKVRWWRRGTLVVVGRRLDGPAPPLVVSLDGQGQGTPTPLPAGRPTPPSWAGGGVASGLLVPVAGCWEIMARTEWDELRFVVYAYPATYLQGWPGLD